MLSPQAAPELKEKRRYAGADAYPEGDYPFPNICHGRNQEKKEYVAIGIEVIHTVASVTSLFAHRKGVPGAFTGSYREPHIPVQACMQPLHSVVEDDGSYEASFSLELL